MAVEQMNDSYNRCINELRSRYKGRGVVSNFKQEMALLAQKENNEVKAAAENYVLFDSRSGIAESYRSGIYKGGKYMTSSDFIRYFNSRRAFYMPEALRAEQEAKTAVSRAAAVPQRRADGKNGREMTASEKTSKEGHLKTLVASLVELKDKWFPVEPMEGRVNNTQLRVPVRVISGMAAFTLSLGLIVGGSVMIGSASGELGKLNSEAAALEATQAELEGKLDLKYDITQIERDVKELGMISNDYVEHKYVETPSDNQVIVFEDGKDENVGLAALLASFGINVD